jgi:hypothetical protein
MVEISVIASALASLKAMKDIAQAMVGLRDSAAFQEKVIEFQSKILDAQSAISALQEERSVLIERIRTLEEEVTKAKAWDAEKQRYQLQAVDRGAFAYVLKPEVQGSEPPHWLCANCYSKGHKSFLQFREQLHTPGGGRGDHSRWTCASCRSEITVFYNREPAKS